jgi:hypothetical protein
MTTIPILLIDRMRDPCAIAALFGKASAKQSGALRIEEDDPVDSSGCGRRKKCRYGDFGAALACIENAFRHVDFRQSVGDCRHSRRIDR